MKASLIISLLATVLALPSPQGGGWTPWWFKNWSGGPPSSTIPSSSSSSSSTSSDGRSWELYDDSAAGCRIGNGGQTTASLGAQAVDSEAEKLSAGKSSSKCSSSGQQYKCTFGGVIHLTLTTNPTRIHSVLYAGKDGTRSTDCKVAKRFS
ncbi:hypothetical protein PYCC9005_002046 [Savitreella phatthalungensis]